MCLTECYPCTYHNYHMQKQQPYLDLPQVSLNFRLFGSVQFQLLQTGHDFLLFYLSLFRQTKHI